MEKSAQEMRRYETLLIDRSNGIFRITMNRPKRKNAISLKMYDEISEALREAAEDESCVIAVMTGTGDFYSSGNDLNNINDTSNTPTIFRDFVRVFIDFPKPLIALVNGPAVGAAVTTLGLFDAVFASDKATFHTPFTKLALCPEGCSSYIFPKLMGNVKANDLLLFNKKITAQEAYERNLVSEVIPDHAFRQETERKIFSIAKLPKGSLHDSKRLMRAIEKQKLHAVNDEEFEVLIGRFQSPEPMKMALKFLKGKSSKL